MKTKEQILTEIRAGRKMDCIDGRDFSRLADFYSVEEAKDFGMEPKAGVDLSAYVPLEWTRGNILYRLEIDLAFGFTKALGKRGISSSLMYSVVKMWMWVLDDPLQNFKDYAQYGLPFFKAVALKYGFPNPIGKHSGTEPRYASES